MIAILQQIENELNESVIRYTALASGDINKCFCLFTARHRYFLKLNDAGSYPQMFEQEAAGLDALRNGSNLIVPKIINRGTCLNQQWLLLQWLEKTDSNITSLQAFGRSVAAMHSRQQRFFGWHTNNFIGSIKQVNTPHEGWAAFYTDCRISPLVRHLFNAGVFTRQDISRADRLCEKLESLLPIEPPALLHGDLWAGNYMIVKEGTAIYDPAVYYGHREMDIGMTKLFGGFDNSFYDVYEEEYPLEKGWVQRLPIVQLYPLLVHAVLFGGHYISTCRQLLKKLG